MTAPATFRISRGIYRVLLFLYPPSFRRDYGALMVQAFNDRARDRGAARTWLFIGRDLVRSVPTQIMEVTMKDERWLAVLTALASVTLVTVLTLGMGSPLMLAIGAVFVVAIAAFFVMAKRGTRSTEYVVSDGPAPKRWTWWTVLATALAVLYVLAGIGQLIDDPKATNVGALFIIIAFAGFIVGGLALRQRNQLAGYWMIIFATVPALLFFWVVFPPLVALAIIFGAVVEMARAPQRPQAA